MKETVLAALGAVGLFVLGLATEAFRSWHAGRAADRQRQAQRTQERQDRRDAFELDTLFQLQDSVQSLSRMTVGAFQRQEEHYASTGEWGTPDLPDEAGRETNWSVLANFVKLLPRIFDEELRDLLHQFVDASGKVYMSGDDPQSAAADRRREEAGRQLGSLGQLERAIQDRLGARLRDIHGA